jgi:hypothetical protein
MSHALRTGDHEVVSAFVAKRVVQVPSNTAHHWPNPATTRTSQYNQSVKVVMFSPAVYGVNVTDYIAVSPASVAKRAGVLGELERLQRDLDRLQDGWAGPGSRAPSDKAKRNVERLLSILPDIAHVPEVEVDEDGGDITLRWPGATTLAFVLRGNDRVLIVKTKVDDRPVVNSKSFNVGEEASIMRYVSDDAGETFSRS